MPRYTIRYRPDADGFWYELRDSKRRIVATAWRAGDKRYAQEEARRERENVQAKIEVA